MSVLKEVGSVESLEFKEASSYSVIWVYLTLFYAYFDDFSFVFRNISKLFFHNCIEADLEPIVNPASLSIFPQMKVVQALQICDFQLLRDKYLEMATRFKTDMVVKSKFSNTYLDFSNLFSNLSNFFGHFEIYTTKNWNEYDSIDKFNNDINNFLFFLN